MIPATSLTDSRSPSLHLCHSDEELMHDLARGRHEALTPLYARYAPLILHVAMRHVERPAAEEILQEVCVTLWRYASRFDSEQGTLRSWLLRMVRWKVLNELRHRRHQPRLVADEFELKEPLHYVADEEPGPDERAIQVERDHLVQSALAALPPKERQAVSLAFLGNLTHQEVAATLNLPLGTAKTRIRSGLEKMRLHLAPLAGSLPALAGW